MADKYGNKIAKDYAVDVPFSMRGNFHVKGMQNMDWGMKARLSRIFNPDTGKTVMLAFDHGYIMGSTAGLERLDLAIPPLLDDVDVLMGTRGAIRTSVPPECKKGIALRASAGSTVVDEDMSHEVIGVDIEDAIRIDATCLAVQTFIGAPGEKTSLENLVKTVDMGNKYGIPVLGVVAVGKNMERTPKFFKLATRVLAELGAHIIKTYYCDEFEEIVAACPVPIVVAGGKKVSEKEALELAYNAMSKGAVGVDMGRNIFQAESPKAMAKAIAKVVHENYTAEEAFAFYEEEKVKY